MSDDLNLLLNVRYGSLGDGIAPLPRILVTIPTHWLESELEPWRSSPSTFYNGEQSSTTASYFLPYLNDTGSSTEPNMSITDAKMLWALDAIYVMLNTIYRHREDIPYISLIHSFGKRLREHITRVWNNAAVLRNHASLPSVRQKARNDFYVATCVNRGTHSSLLDELGSQNGLVKFVEGAISDHQNLLTPSTKLHPALKLFSKQECSTMSKFHRLGVLCLALGLKKRDLWPAAKAEPGYPVFTAIELSLISKSINVTYPFRLSNSGPLAQILIEIPQESHDLHPWTRQPIGLNLEHESHSRDFRQASAFLPGLKFRHGETLDWTKDQMIWVLCATQVMCITIAYYYRTGARVEQITKGLRDHARHCQELAKRVSERDPVVRQLVMIASGYRDQDLHTIRNTKEWLFHHPGKGGPWSHADPPEAHHEFNHIDSDEMDRLLEQHFESLERSLANRSFTTTPSGAVMSRRRARAYGFQA
ncbi:hypothetical protein OIO90_004569 [Microbotryomycetes sp. JL221]|nr:hypothetical protein OIO90_004569 [Microbotryomycetes sp. JL221]